MLKIVIETSNTVFQGHGKNFEISRILNEASELVSNGFGSGAEHLRDKNGNKVGILVMDPTRLTEAALLIREIKKNDHVILDIETGNAALRGDDVGYELSRIIKEAAEKVWNDDLNFKLRDANGNIVGKVEECPAVKPIATKVKNATSSLGI